MMMGYKTMRKINSMEIEMTPPESLKSLQTNRNKYNFMKSLSHLRTFSIGCDNNTSPSLKPLKLDKNFENTTPSQTSASPDITRNRQKIRTLTFTDAALSQPPQSIFLTPKPAQNFKIKTKRQKSKFLSISLKNDTPLSSSQDEGSAFTQRVAILTAKNFKKSTFRPEMEKSENLEFSDLKIYRPNSTLFLSKSPPPEIKSVIMPKWYNKRENAMKSEYYRLNFAVTKRQMKLKSGSRIYISSLWKTAEKPKFNKYFSGPLKTNKLMAKPYPITPNFKANHRNLNTPLAANSGIKISHETIQNLKKVLGIPQIMPVAYSLKKNSGF